MSKFQMQPIIFGFFFSACVEPQTITEQEIEFESTIKISSVLDKNGNEITEPFPDFSSLVTDIEDVQIKTSSQIQVNQQATAHLTIDADIQQNVVDVLLQTLGETKAKSVYSIVVEVKTGNIIAMANVNADEPKKVAIAPIFEHTYESGSIMKPFVVAGAFEADLYTPDTVIDLNNGAFNYSGYMIRDDHPKEQLSVKGILQHSSNIGVSKIILNLGLKRWISILRDLGFEDRTTIAVGSKYILSRHSPIGMEFIHNAQEIELITTSYGYGITTSLLQQVYAYAALANNGTRMEPRLIDRFIVDGKPIHSPPSVIAKQVLSRESARQVLLALETVVTEGTGKRAQVSGYRIAGKTGTAKKGVPGGYSDTDRIGSFIGVLPAEEPQYAIGVMVDTPNQGYAYGGVVAAPAFAKIAKSLLPSREILGEPNYLEEQGGTKEHPKSKRNVLEKNTIDKNKLRNILDQDLNDDEIAITLLNELLKSQQGNDILMLNNAERSSYLEDIKDLSTVYGKSIAIIIGIDDYNHLNPLSGATRDAASVAKVFRETLKFDEVILMTDQEVTRNDLEELPILLKKIVQPDDRLVFYFAGHGVMINERGYLLSVDAPNNSQQYLFGLDIHTLEQQLKSLQMRQMMLVIDACHSGVLTQTRSGVEDYLPGEWKEVALLPRYVSMAAVKDNQKAKDDYRGEIGNEPKQGLFTYWFIQGLKGHADLDNDKLITDVELFEYITQQVRLTKGLHDQTPVIGPPYGDGRILFQY